MNELLPRAIELLRSREGASQEAISEVVKSGLEVGEAVEATVREVQQAALESRRKIARACRLLSGEILARSPTAKVAAMLAALRRLAAELGLYEDVPWTSITEMLEAQYGEQGCEQIKLEASKEIKRKPAKVEPASEPQKLVTEVARSKRGRPVATAHRGRPRYDQARGSRRG